MSLKKQVNRLTAENVRLRERLCAMEERMREQERRHNEGPLLDSVLSDFGSMSMRHNITRVAQTPDGLVVWIEHPPTLTA